MMFSEYDSLEIKNVPDDSHVSLISYGNIIKTLRMDTKEIKGKVECSQQVRFSICSEAKNMARRILKLEKELSEYRKSPSQKDVIIEEKVSRILQLEQNERDIKQDAQKKEEELKEIKKELAMRIENFNKKTNTGEIVRGYFKRETKAKFKVSKEEKIIYVQVPFGANISTHIKGVLNKQFPGNKIIGTERI